MLKVDRKRALMISGGVIVFLAFTVYTFSSYSPGPKAGTQIAPDTSTSPITNAGIKNASVLSPQSTNGFQMSSFENKDKQENYYSIKFPSISTVVRGQNSGSLEAKLPQGIVVSTGLVDIPDTSDVQNFILTQVEPSLKSLLANYQRISFEQSSIDERKAWTLTYNWDNKITQENMETVTTFIEGKDNAAELEFSATSKNLADGYNSIILPVTKSFQWIK